MFSHKLLKKLRDRIKKRKINKMLNAVQFKNGVLYCGDALETLNTLESSSIDCVVTSPPYFHLRDYGVKGQIGLESTPELYIERLTLVFSEVMRILKPTGTLWINIGDSYISHKARSNSKHTSSKGKSMNAAYDAMKRSTDLHGKHGYLHKNLIGIPWKLAFALQANGWYLRQEIIWHKPNPMPESVTDRCTKAHETVFMLVKERYYFYNSEAVLEDSVTNAKHKNWKDKNYDQTMLANKQANGVKGRPSGVAGYTKPGKRNRRSVWTIPVKPFKGTHFAVMPTALVEPCILAGCPEDGIVLDPFMGSGTVAEVATSLGRHWIGIELNKDYISLVKNRLDSIKSNRKDLFS